jgi:4-amino-4-deoxy-L-arabinose transferase-like glycosyltransferase
MPKTLPKVQPTFVLMEKSRQLLWCALLFMLAARIVANTLIPLADTTEARYAEIARKMLQTGDWITPQHDYGVPFWAKPPLSTWLAAGSMKILGINEFAARLPSLLLGIATLWLIWTWTVALRGRDFALATTAVLASMVLFFMASGAVMTDAGLVFCTTLAMTAFWQALHTSRKFWGYLFFAGLGLGLLAKGPVVGVLTLLPLLPWIALRRNWREVAHALPWLRGTILMLAIGLPWYWLAEHKTPGFVAYFILGEHFGRFLHAGWTGDKYGNAHAEPIGTIWAYWFASAFPWSFIAIAATLKRIRQRDQWLGDDSGLLSYLFLWGFAAIVFFSFSPNIIWTYALPALPACAVLTMELLDRFRAIAPIVTPHETSIESRLLAATFATPIALLCMTAIYADDQQTLLKSSQRSTATYYLHTRPTADSGLYYFRRYYSAEFYSAGKAKKVSGHTGIDELLHNGKIDFLVMQNEDLEELWESELTRFKPARPFGAYVVLEEIPPVVSQSARDDSTSPPPPS